MSRREISVRDMLSFFYHSSRISAADMTDMISMPSQIAPLVSAVRVSIDPLPPPEFTMMRVFCRVRIETSASMKPIVLSSLTSMSDDLAAFLEPPADDGGRSLRVEGENVFLLLLAHPEIAQSR